EPLKEVTYRGKSYDLSSNPAYQMHVKFIENMQIQEFVAVRKGKLKFRGFKDPPACKHIDVVQKQVDMLIGLDIAHVSYNKLVDRIMIFCADTDLIPALKTARINGLQVILTCCSDVHSTNNNIKKHSDFIRDIKYQDIISKIIKP
nr:NYN domain-containing protein [Smithellaceae bacterium]